MAEQFQLLLDSLSDQALKPTPEEVADALWLVTRLFDQDGDYENSLHTEGSENKLLLQSQQVIDAKFDKQKTAVPSARKSGIPVENAKQPENDLYAHGLDAKGKSVKGYSIRIPSAPVLPHMLEMERSLRPLARRMPSRQRWELDDKATADFIATSNIWNIIRRPVSERWLEGVLIIEQSPTMRLWQDAVREFRNLLWRVGVFRSLETFQLDAFTETPFFRLALDTQKQKNLRAVLHPGAPRVIFFCTDSLSNAWLSGKIPEWLATWGKHHPTVIIQVLPDYMWQRTSLRNAQFKSDTSTIPGRPPRPIGFQAGNNVAGMSAIPVVSMDPKSLRNLSNFLTAAKGNRVLCYLNPPNDFYEATVNPSGASISKEVFQPNPTLTSEIFERFKQNSSPATLELAKYLAITPLFLPVMRLVQHTLVKNSQPAHLAELFYSGLIYRLSPKVPNENINQIEYDFLPGIREELLNQGGIPRIAEVWGILSQYLNSRFEKSADFLGILHDPSSIHEFISGIRDEAQKPFARVGAAVLRRLGGEYTKAASYLEDSFKTGPVRLNKNTKSEYQKPNDFLHNTLNTARSYITKNEPFGPVDSTDIGTTDIKAMSMLFEQHNMAYKGLRNRPSIIIGRNGSGKTTYLRSALFDMTYNYCLEIHTAKVLGQVANMMRIMLKVAVFPEMVSKLWEMIIWVGIFSEIRKRMLLPSDEIYAVNSYLDNLNIHPDNNVDGVFSDLAKTFDEVLYRNLDGEVAEIMKELGWEKFDSTRLVVLNHFERSKTTFVILMDSLDDFQLDVDTVAHSLQGLLKLVGSMNKPRDVVDIRFCLPAEAYHRFTKISSNPNKDFRRTLHLQWSANELIFIGAKRLGFYLDIYYPDLLRPLYPLNVSNQADALRMFYAVLPEKVENQAGFQEDTVSYILRHTQLLPRHFIMLLNSIFRKTGFTQTLNPFPIQKGHIINGIRQVEELIVKDIFVAFKLIYPTAEETCRRCLPELGHKFTLSDLHRVFTRHGKAVFGTDNLFEFQRMLIEIGAIGKVIPGKDSDLYIKGSFEYTAQHQLSLRQDDELCVHPLFSGIFQNNRIGGRPVYPLGGNVLDDENY